MDEKVSCGSLIVFELCYLEEVFKLEYYNWPFIVYVTVFLGFVPGLFSKNLHINVTAIHCYFQQTLNKYFVRANQINNWSQKKASFTRTAFNNSINFNYCRIYILLMSPSFFFSKAKTLVDFLAIQKPGTNSTIALLKLRVFIFFFFYIYSYFFICKEQLLVITVNDSLICP